MKKYFTILFLLLSTIVRAQHVDTVEYFFDTDPGLGKGSLVAVTGATLDSSINFTAGNLASGVHILYVRIKNSANKWSTVYQSSILIANGVAGTTKITEAEYYYDTDPGFGKGKSIVLNKTSIDSSLAFSVTGLTAGPHTIYIRLKDNSNAWSTVYSGSFLLSSGAGGAAFTAAEYYFDADPGVGKGKQILVNSMALDSTFKFSVNGLTNGVHTVYLRLKNADNNWSFPYQQNFVVAIGKDSAASINTIQYFVDTDAVAKTKTISFSNTAKLDTTISVAVSDNGSDKRVLGLRVKNETGHLSTTVLNDVSLCDLYKPDGGFRTAQYGATFTLIDTTHNNVKGKIKWYADGVLFDSNYAVNYKFASNKSFSTVKISQVTGTGCRVDTVIHSLNMAGIESISPYSGSYNSDFNLNLYGGGLDTSLVIYMQKGDTTVYPYMKVAYDGFQHLIAVFDFHGFKKTYGFPTISEYYTVHIKYPDGRETVMTDAVNLEKQENNTKVVCGWPVLAIHQSCPENQLIRRPDPEFVPIDSIPEPYFATNMTGNTSMRAGLWNNLTFSITNTGKVVARGIPFFIMVPGSFDIDTAQWNIINPDKGMRDSISIITPVDTVINGVHHQYKLIAMIYPLLAPSETGYLNLRVRTNVVQPFNIYYAAQSRMFGSPMTYAFGPCWGAIFDFGIGFIPGVSCLYAFGNLINDQVNFGLQNSHSNGDWFSLGLSYAGTAVSCIPGGGPFKQFAEAAAHEAGFVKAGLGELTALNTADKGLGVISNTNSAANASDPCSRVKQDPKQKPGTPFASFDPNYIVGNSDYDSSKNYINNYSPQHYTVGVENKPTATASAQHVFIADTLNAAKFDFKSFTMSNFMIGDSTYSLPPYRYQVVKDVVLKNRKDMKVRFTANFDTAKGILSTDFFSLDSSGNILPKDTIAGFLPPNKDGVMGTASVSYSLYIQNLGTQETFTNKASIYFDANAPIATNTWLNTVDTTAPKTKIAGTIRVNDTTVKIIIKQSDVGSGNWYNSLYGKKSTDKVFGEFGKAAGDTIIFKGSLGQTYKLYVKGNDRVGNKEKKDSVPEITYTFQKALPVTFLNFNAVKTGDSVRLTWSTATEINVSHYEVEKSMDDASGFVTIGSVAASSKIDFNNYTLYDAHPGKINYYRVKEVDHDGKYIYSRIVRIDVGDRFSITVTPIPAHNYVDIEGAANFTRIEFIDVGGRTVKQFTNITGTRFSVAELKPGTYFIRLIGKNTTQTEKLIKQ